MESQILDRLDDGYITTIEIYCRKMAIIEDRLLSYILGRYHHHGEWSSEWVYLVYDIVFYTYCLLLFF